MSVYECRGCGRKTEIDDECCGRLMRKRGDSITCLTCGNSMELPSCCGEGMARIIL